MNFSWPWILALLAAVPFLTKQRGLNAIKVSGTGTWQGTRPPPRVKWIAPVRRLQTAAAALLIVALAGPYTERPVLEETRRGIAIQLLIDISSSMDQSITTSEGGKQTRMETAKAVVEQFIGRRPDDLIGLITFARYADTLSPLTFGHSALIQLVRELKIQDRPNEDGTAYGDALALACAHLEQMKEWRGDREQNITTRSIILMTDGENNCGLHLPQEAAGLAVKWGIRLYAISLGGKDSADGLTDGEKLLQAISEATGGAYWKIADGAELEEACATIDRLEKSDIQSAVPAGTETAPLFSWFLLPALLLLLTERILRSTWLRTAEETPAGLMKERL